MNLNQVTIPSKDLEKSVPFYLDLGLLLIVDARPNYVRFECPTGDSTFSIHKVDDLYETSVVSIYFETDNLDNKVVDLKASGIKFDSDPEDKPWLWREAHLNDPDGNRLILYHAGDNRKNPPWRVK